MTVYAITDTKKGEQGLRLLIFKLPSATFVCRSVGRSPACFLTVADQSPHLDSSTVHTCASVAPFLVYNPRCAAVASVSAQPAKLPASSFLRESSPEKHYIYRCRLVQGWGGGRPAKGCGLVHRQRLTGALGSLSGLLLAGPAQCPQPDLWVGFLVAVAVPGILAVERRTDRQTDRLDCWCG